MATSRARDVALRAGVSRRTVANVVGGYAPVADETRARVEAAIAELGYKPNIAARALKSGRSGLLAMAVPELDVPYFSELARAVIAEGRRRGYTVMLDQTDGDVVRERELIAHDSRLALFDGVILSPQALSREDLADCDPRVPLVLLGERFTQSTFDHIAIDNVSAARQAVHHLFDMGHQRVAAIGDQPYETGETAQLRTVGYRLAHADAGREVDESLVVPTRHFHRALGAEAMVQLLDHPGGPPTAVFCYNDLLALGAVRAALRAGLRVPQDIAVMGFDNIQEGEYSTPSLSTIAPDKHQIAALAIGRLLARLGGADEPPREIAANYEILVRESSRPSAR